MPPLTDPTCSKADFARLMDVSKGRVTQWIDARQIFGEAIVGEGRKARIHIERAKVQLRGRLDVSQSLVNGAQSRRALDRPAEPPLETLSPRVRRLLHELPSDIAWSAISLGCPAWIAHALEDSLRMDIVGGAALIGVQVDPADITPTNWRILFAEYRVAEPLDIEAWRAKQVRQADDLDARLAADDRKAR